MYIVTKDLIMNLVILSMVLVGPEILIAMLKLPRIFLGIFKPTDSNGDSDKSSTLSFSRRSRARVQKARQGPLRDDRSFGTGEMSPTLWNLSDKRRPRFPPGTFWHIRLVIGRIGVSGRGGNVSLSCMVDAYFRMVLTVQKIRVIFVKVWQILTRKAEVITHASPPRFWNPRGGINMTKDY